MVDDSLIFAWQEIGLENASLPVYLYQAVSGSQPEVLLVVFCHGTDVVVGKNTRRKGIRFIRFHGIAIV